MSIVEWQDGQPFSTQFGDVYFSRESGLEETRYVYLDHNQLSSRFAALKSGEHFTIAENGFGTGLNFLAAWQLWKQNAPKDAYLHFVSTEAFPLSLAEMEQAAEAWPELKQEYAALIQTWQSFATGFHRLHPGASNLTLTLLIGDSNQTLPQLDAEVDAWFLDGFAPAKNPEMWSEAVMQQIGRLTKIGGTFATFTSAGFVKRALQAQGFEVRKVSGYGRKREMICGQLTEKVTPNLSWTAQYRHLHAQPIEHHAIIIGGGLAGCSLAHSLARRGWKIDIVEAKSSLASAASGNAAGVLYARLAPKMGTLAQLILGGLQYSQRWVKQWLPLESAEGEKQWSPCGVIQLAFNEDETTRIAGLSELGFPDNLMRTISKEEASQIAGLPIEQSGLFYPQAGWVHPPSLCHAAVLHDNISIHLNTKISKLQHSANAWTLFQNEIPVLSAPIVILACANDALHIEEAAQLPIRTLKGQVSYLPATAESEKLNTVICAEGYLAPERNAQHAMGATFDPHATDLSITHSAHLENLDTLSGLSKTAFDALAGEQLREQLNNDQLPAGMGGRAAYRAVTPDYTPIIGPMANMDSIITSKKITQPLKHFSHQDIPWHTGLFASLAHGTRGLITAPIAAEVIASFLMNEPCPVPTDQLVAMQPTRFPLKPNPIPRSSD
ncbi:bifunctional tRNA (5-methylaminomethyl-2-thiouridine)(34)-methyltransferase MnmD/FAD-dependent 5-carboxymethylaminomethyl-2-thiouridine(34) oxidoreductase MnmC [Leeia sp. TBRC 13508]|uniref:tRNA 5-methylaminomethyl-2-thiouridine biosynthesis bifunctional protein MnmC n=1 Tax=Leeia speluncae TaxID=2884804 RepID=A0ABS8D175_9NEIS|nr:bifunctional tRNA (5-methylaminomethyl-2-thiouridine)(34)-methyltransferase MnmD/FAD-dependent 5-carboxymethylaminomethyl-2-thiouridine(34) oxidoreductase MnmC [Leeia speluncae]MCB6181944.1 bifunctional tRNA (5-methylaminomethyl-2-thiouridine)(34)-methyltransferase MnmD/FAD-dependent 5-carboxymethylaminomethyl-2-thiouridine(34) oxidoreductase MnmC [Leeia speluncae]